ncbi:ABC-three component system middle component 7 [Azotosporobacter soli]|uniref:ABC-three component system middle component 7 n=1 Tax=Azotosporobacter soli TaxID=3055040 RepID=UPI0031FE5B72
MILPNKLINFHDSIMGKLVYILDEVITEKQNIACLYDKVKNNFEDINQYILTLDVLCVLKKIRMDEEKQVIIYVGKNNL